MVYSFGLEHYLPEVTCVKEAWKLRSVSAITRSIHLTDRAVMHAGDGALSTSIVGQ